MQCIEIVLRRYPNYLNKICFQFNSNDTFIDYKMYVDQLSMFMNSYDLYFDEISFVIEGH